MQIPIRLLLHYIHIYCYHHQYNNHHHYSYHDIPFTSHKTFPSLASALMLDDFIAHSRWPLCSLEMTSMLTWDDLYAHLRWPLCSLEMTSLLTWDDLYAHLRWPLCSLEMTSMLTWDDSAANTWLYTTGSVPINKVVAYMKAVTHFQHKTLCSIQDPSPH